MSKIHKKTGNFCLICDEDVSDGITFHKTRRQTHRLCIDCCDGYLIPELKKVNSNLRNDIRGDNTSNIKCPGSIHSEMRNLCKCKIDLRKLIIPEKSECSLDLFRIKYVFSNKLAFICREEKCGEIVSLDYDYQMLNIKCPSCSTTWCRQCNVIPFHYNMSCIEYETENKNSLNAKFIWKMREKGELQFCPEPKCKAPTVKNSGCFSGDTKILMWDSGIKEAKDIVIGDKLTGDDSCKRIVKELFRGIDDMYEIKQEKAMKYIVNSQHKLCLKITDHKIIFECIDKIKVKWFDHSILKYQTKIFLLSEIKEATNYRDSIVFGDVLDITVNEYLTMSNKVKQNLFGYRSNYGSKCVNSELTKDLLNTCISVSYVGKYNYYGWSVDKNERFVLEDYTVVHNCNKMICESCHTKWCWLCKSINIDYEHYNENNKTRCSNKLWEGVDIEN